jgi:hypothetical protein
MVGARKLGRSWSDCFGNFAAMVLGALLVGAATVTWLYATGNLPSFVEAAFSDWNRDYWANSPSMTQRAELLMDWFWPWSLVHLITVPASIAVIARFCHRKRGIRYSIGHSQVLLAAFYLGWFFQANVLQRQLPYHLMPTILLAVPLLFGIPWLRFRWMKSWPLCEPICRWAIIAVFLCYTWTEQHGIRARRLSLWRDCWTQGSTPLMRTRLSLERDIAAPDWLELDQVRRFLDGQHVRDGELNCYAVSSLSLYTDLKVKPGNPFLYGWGTVSFFKHHKSEIFASMIDSPERFIVNDYMQAGKSREEARQRDPRMPSSLLLPVPADLRGEFPWDYPYAFRAGRYIVQLARPAVPDKGAASAHP